LSTTNTDIGNFGTANFTIEFWLYSQGSLAAFGMPISAYNADNTAFHWSIQLDRDGVGNIYWYNQINLGINSSIKLVNNQWTHLAVVRNGGTTTMYVNGLSGGSFSDSTNYVTPSGLVIGSDLANPQSWEFNGYLSNLRIVKGTAVYTSAFTPPTEPLTAISGTSLLINGTDASIIDATQSSALTLVGNTKSSTTQIKYGNSSMFFDGTGDYLTAPSSTNFAFGTGDFTIETWVYLNGPKSQNIFDTRNNSSSATGIAFVISADNFPWVYVNSAALFTSPTALSLNIWTHVAIVKYNGTITLYINGTTPATGGSAASATSLTDTSCTIGTVIDYRNSSAIWHLNGFLQDLRVTKGLARYTTNFTPPAALLEG
jgi:hypothetical protein